MWLLPLDGDRKPVPYLQTPFNEVAGQFSPNGRWMAYASNESGQPQIYVQPIPASGVKRQISTAGGDQPRWRRDGTELFYVSANQKLMTVPVKPGAVFEIGFPLTRSSSSSPSPLHRQAALRTNPPRTASDFYVRPRERRRDPANHGRAELAGGV